MNSLHKKPQTFTTWNFDDLCLQYIYIAMYISGQGCDRMVVGFTITYAISAYNHKCCEFESRSGRGVQTGLIIL
jgi:hypothetical protein